MALYLSALLLLLASLSWAASILRRRRRLATVSYVELSASGSLPEDAALTRPLASDITDALLDASLPLTPASLTVIRTFESGVTRCFLALTNLSPQSRAILLSSLSRGLSLTASPVDSIPLPEATYLLSSVRGPREGRERLGGVGEWSDAVVQTFEAAAEPAFLAVGIEALSHTEVKRHHAWLASVLEAAGETPSTHPQFSSAKLTRARFLAGVSSPEHASSLLSGAANYLPGYDFALSSSLVTEGRAHRALLALGATLSLLLWGSSPLPLTLTPLVLALLSSLVLLSGKVSFVKAPLLSSLAAGVVDQPSSSLLRRLALDRLVERLLRSLLAAFAARRAASLAAKSSPTASARWSSLASRLRTSRRPRDIRSHPTQVLAPEQLAALLVPPGAHQGSASSTVKQVAAPTAVRTARGAFLGLDPEDARCILPDADRQLGLFVTGDAGKGKTRLVEQVFAEDAAALSPGRTLLALDVKGDGCLTADLTEIASALDASTRRIDVAGHSGSMLRLLDPENPHASAELFVDALVYAFPDGSIQYRSRAALTPLVELALHYCALPESAGERNPIALTWTLMDGDGPEARERIVSALRRAQVTAVSPATPTPTLAPAPTGTSADAVLGTDDLFAAFLTPQPSSKTPEDAAEVSPSHVVVPSSELSEALRVYDGLPKSKTERERYFDAPRNKIQALLATPQVWHLDDRPSLPLAELVQSGDVVLVNFGAEPGGAVLGEEKAALLASIVTFQLWSTVKATCAGWLATDRSLTLYCDELSQIAGTDEDATVIADMKDRGRAMGLRLVLATQRAEQLPRRVAEAALSMGAQAYLGLRNASVAEAAIRQLVGGVEDSFTLDDLMNLPRGEALVTLHVDGSPIRRPFSLRVADVRAELGI